MTPEIVVLLQRAAARRAILEGLVESIPAIYWGRQAPNDRWSARNHLEHLATIDGLVLVLVQQADAGARVLWLGGPRVGDLERHRTEAMTEAATAPISELQVRMRTSRRALADAIGRLGPWALDASVRIAGADDGWGAHGAWSLRAYLTGWAEHDSDHETAIRQASTAAPEPGMVALMQRRVRASGSTTQRPD